MDTLIGSTLGCLVGGFPLILLLAGVAIGWWFISGKPAADARALKQKFGSLGVVKGKTLEEITRVVGNPKSIVAVGDGRVNYGWNVQKYYVTLVFEDNICQGIASEISV